MKKLLAALVLLLFVITSSNGQTIPPVLTTTEYSVGIYRTYGEFLKNSPSITDRFTYKTYSGTKKVEHDQAVYHLVMLDSMVRKRDMKKFWGFSDGKNIFINEMLISGNLSFRKLQGVGRYCFLFATPPNPNQYNPMMGGAIGAVAPNIPRLIDGDEPYVLNINNGKFFLLNRKTLVTVLEKDPALLREYEVEEKARREQTYVAYIQRYNQTHLHEANLELWSDRELCIFRTLKKELDEPVALTINDTLNLSLAPNEVLRLKLQGEKAKLCHGDACTEIQLNRKGINYVSTSLRKAGERATIKASAPESGEFQVNAIEKGTVK